MVISTAERDSRFGSQLLRLDLSYNRLEAPGPGVSHIVKTQCSGIYRQTVPFAFILGALIFHSYSEHVFNTIKIVHTM
jgi:hypothetical protein